MTPCVDCPVHRDITEVTCTCKNCRAGENVPVLKPAVMVKFLSVFFPSIVMTTYIPLSSLHANPTLIKTYSHALSLL